MEEDGPTLVESSSNPLLWLGHEYILYLNDKDGDGRYAVDSGNAQYTIENGLITTPGDTEWAKNANGMPVGDFIAQIERDVAAGNAGR